MPSGSNKPTHRFELRVYYEDTDAGGVAYYANYLKFAERARTEWLRHLGFSQSALWEEEGIGFAVRRASVEFLKPARLDDHLSVETRLTRATPARLEMAQKVLRGEEVLAEVAVTLACVDRGFKPAKLPESLRMILMAD